MLLGILFNIFFVTFTDKPEKSAPALSERAIEQRRKWNIGIDEMDYPVSALYLNKIIAEGGKIHHTSRWFNGATVEMSDETASKIAQLEFVESVEMTRKDEESGERPVRAPKLRMPEWEIAISHTDEQLKLYNLLELHKAGFEGQGILMTVCDGGFSNANKLSCFRKELELGHFDFTDDTDDFYGWTGDHGTECLSAISGLADGYHGAAVKAQYYLMRSEEYYPESPKEMDNLVAALEKSDSLGVNVFSVSLGYAQFDNKEWTLDKKRDLDGQTTRSSRAATIAARKGMLVCVAAGNEGDVAWKTISSPADADSILTVGAVDKEGVIADFSSYGPSSDGRIKPEVCAVGKGSILINPSGTIVSSNGTSFATPLLAGMAASLWSALPKENAMQIRERILRSADRYDHPDEEQYGYGIPDAWKAYQMNLPSGIEEATETEEQPRKILRGNQVLIVRYGHIYNLAGQRVE